VFGLIVAMTVVGAAPAFAASLAGVTLPDAAKVGDVDLVLNGLGLREATFLKVDVYVAGLYLESKSSDAEAILGSTSPKVLHMQFVRKVGRDDITGAWVEGFEKNSPANMDALRSRIDTLNGWMTNVVKGDTIRFTWTADGAVEVAVGGTTKGTIEGADFGSALLAVFLGPQPPNAGLKEGLLGR